MPAAARAATPPAPPIAIPTGTLPDNVLSPDGFLKDCAFPGVVPIVVGNLSNVFVNGLPVPVLTNPVPVHQVSGCAPDISVLTTASTSVFIGGLGAARIGDLYGNNIIISGSPNVFIGG